MDEQTAGNFIGVIFLFRFIIIPLAAGLISVIKLFSMKKTIEKAGKNYCKTILKVKKHYFGSMIFITTIVLILSYLTFMTGRIIILLTSLGITLYFIGDLLCYKIYGNVAGIYENGIININKKLLRWNKIHSYSIEENGIKGYFMNGNLFEFNDVENIDAIKYLFEKNTLMKRE